MIKRIAYILLISLMVTGNGFAKKPAKPKPLTPEQIAQMETNKQEMMINRIRDLAMQDKCDEAYQRLVTLLKNDIDAKEWEAAAERAEMFRHFFGNYAPFLDLMRVLTTPIDTTVKAEAFPSTINTNMGSEYSPTLTGDCKTIYFCGRFRQDNLGSEDIFVAHKKGDYWLPARLVKELSTPNGNEAPESVSQDGQTMLLFFNGQLYISQKTVYGWSQPQILPKSINNSLWQADAILSADGRAMLFAAKKAVKGEERESMNIFVSTLDANGIWSEPKSLGPTINTPMDERSPVLYSDMKTLYFCSSGHSTLGGLDVFKTTRKYEDSWTDWTEPVNLGKEINTTGDDCWYKITTDGTTAYFAKSPDDMPNALQASATLPTSGKKAATTTVNKPSTLDLYWVTLPLQMRPDPVSTVSGVITDLGGKPLPATIVWEDLTTHKEIGYSQSDPITGEYFITLPSGKLYGYFVEKQGYWPASDYVDMRIDSAAIDTVKEIHKVENIKLASVRQMREQNLGMRINNVFFELDKADLLPESITELRRIAAFIRANSLKVEIGGHTDIRGTEAHNMDLSKRRAEAVMKFLIDEGGCHPTRLSATGYGASMPIAPNDTEENMQLNRRVEVKIK